MGLEGTGVGLVVLQQVQTEEAVVGVPVLRQPSALAHQVACPGGLAVVVAVAVGSVVHDLAVAQQVAVVNLPEDDGPVAAYAQAVALCGLLQLAVGHVAVGDHGAAEVRRRALSLLPPAASLGALGLYLLPQRLERMLEKLFHPVVRFHIRES